MKEKLKLTSQKHKYLMITLSNDIPINCTAYKKWTNSQRHKISLRLNQEEIETRSVTNSEIESVI